MYFNVRTSDVKHLFNVLLQLLSMKLVELQGGRFLITETKKVSGFSRRSAEPCLITCWDNRDKFWIQRYGKVLFGLQQTQANAAIFSVPLGTGVGFTS